MKLILIGRLSKSCYLHNNILTEKFEFRLLKRKSKGALSDLIDEASYDIPAIDFSKYEEGIYQLVTCNESYDIESGYVDDYDFKLVPYEIKALT